MTTRTAFSNLTNNAIRPAVAGKRVTRAATTLARGSSVSNQKTSLKIQGKENVVVGLKNATNPVVKPVRPTRVAARRLSKTKPVEVQNEPMDVETVVQESLPGSLPSGVVDIDAADSANPQLCAEYATEIYKYLRTLEAGVGYTVKEDYLSGCPITGKMRAVLADWMVEVQQQFRLLQETLFMTMSIIDRYLALEGKTVHRSQLQLVGVSAMFLASKVEEIFAPEVSDFVYITDNAYTGEEIRHMELKILNALNFDLCRPISLNFLRRFSKAGDVDLLQHSVAKYILEQGLLDYSLASLQPSLMAASALHLSLLLTDADETASFNSVWNINLQHYSAYSSKQLMPTVKKLASMLAKAENAKLQAVRSKYSSVKFMKVAVLPQLKSGMMTRLC